MEAITGASKKEDGVVVEYKKGSGYAVVGFTYQDLIDQGINALDLVEHPTDYEVDPETRQLSACPAKCESPASR
ncbi:hypothetical protein [Methanofollis fontis]|uniref:Uncharacterized protein n=1 Tax=Methanofollis fontis TaxID=2052832 RepID=A0A483CQM9_9EURY|nr:hypothetical protein [Methanofollis fontis]TAJ45425.1 hypothetical protein CUJ86_01435 [Methanofollis fontis]